MPQLDPNIILSGNQPQQIDIANVLANVMQLKKQNAELQAQQQAVQQQNALKQVLTAPDALSDTGLPKPNTLARVMQIDPKTGIQMADQIGQAEQRQATAEHTKSETQQQQRKQYSQEVGDALSIYDGEMSSGNVPPTIAERNLRSSLAEQIDGMTIAQSDKDRLKKVAAEASLPALRTYAMSDSLREEQSKLQAEREPKIINGQPGFVDKTGNVYDAQGKRITDVKSIENPTGAGEEERERHDRAVEREAGARINITEGGKWQVLHDPKNNVDYRYNPETGQSTSLDGKQAYEPAGAAKIAGGATGTARSPETATFLKWQQEHPNATPDEELTEVEKLRTGVKAARDFSTGKQGQQINSFNTAIAHLNTMDGLVKALGNGDIQVVNKLANNFAAETGSPAPTNFDAAKAIVGDEIIKAIVGSGGALADRENAQNQLNRAKSPQQLAGIIDTYKDLMAGQLTSLRTQYKQTTGRDDFDDKLLPSTKDQLSRSHLAGDKGPTKIKDTAGYNALPKGSHYIDPNGVERVKQ